MQNSSGEDNRRPIRKMFVREKLRTLEERHIYLLSHVSVCLGSKNQTRRETIASLEINKKGMKSVNEE